MTSTRFSTGTIAARGGEEHPLALGAAQVPIFQCAAFAYPDFETWQEAALGNAVGDIYSRNSNPTISVFEEKIRLLERAAAATSVSSGMAAISNTLFGLACAGALREANPSLAGNSLPTERPQPRGLRCSLSICHSPATRIR